MSTTIRNRLGTLLLLFSAGCVGPVEIGPLPYAHPANPDAPAGMTPDAGSMLNPASPDEQPDSANGGMEMKHDMGGMQMSHGEHASMKGMQMNGMKESGSYQCPMHPEVRSGKPGKCPVCGMRMVKKGGGAKHEEDHER